MSSYAKQIGDGIVAVIQGLSGAPSTVQYRKEDALLSREEITATDGAVIVSVGRERPTGRTFGTTIFKEYTGRVTYYRKPTIPGGIATDLDTNPLFLLQMKQALDGTSLTGASVVWSVDIIEHSEWEEQAIGQGAEVSTFGLLIKTNEPTNG